VFEWHVIKPVSKKQSDLTVYFLSDNVVVLFSQSRAGDAELFAGTDGVIGADSSLILPLRRAFFGRILTIHSNADRPFGRREQYKRRAV
jgi:hypothetical protein